MPYVPFCTFPPLLVRPSKSFEQFYLWHSGRKLTWLPYCSSRILGRENTSHTRKSKRFRMTRSATYNHLGVRSSRNLRDTTRTGRVDLPRGFVLVQRRFLTPLQKIKLVLYCTMMARVESGEERKDSEPMLKGVHNTDYESSLGNDT
jgi:hypothetical protein